MAIKPSLQALWLADEVFRDDDTGKETVAGIFDQIEVAGPSAEYASPAWLYFVLRDVHGRVSFTLAYVDLSTNEALVERDLAITGEGPLTSTVVCIRMPRLPVPHPGAYAWELYWENDMIGSARVQALVRAEPAEGGESNA